MPIGMGPFHTDALRVATILRPTIAIPYSLGFAARNSHLANVLAFV
jgi:hypothetical protein